jgi:hypothetical protein
MKTAFRIAVFPFAMVFMCADLTLSVGSKVIDEVIDAWNYWTE